MTFDPISDGAKLEYPEVDEPIRFVKTIERQDNFLAVNKILI
jgi:hypothetical protein